MAESESVKPRDATKMLLARGMPNFAWPILPNLVVSVKSTDAKRRLKARQIIANCMEVVIAANAMAATIIVALPIRLGVMRTTLVNTTTVSI